jgi:hypothetical protein
MKLLQKSLDDLKKTNSGILKKTEFGEEDILRGSTNMRWLSCNRGKLLCLILLFILFLECETCIHFHFYRSSGKQIQSLVNSIHKAESSAAGTWLHSNFFYYIISL